MVLTPLTRLERKAQLSPSRFGMPVVPNSAFGEEFAAVIRQRSATCVTAKAVANDAWTPLTGGDPPLSARDVRLN